MSNAPTAEDFKNYSGFIEENDRLIEFAKLHVTKALKAVHEYYEVNYDIYPFPDNEINVDTDIYPLQNIK